MSVVRALGPLRAEPRWLDPGTDARGAAIAGVLLVALFVLPLTGGDWIGTFTSVAIYSVVAAGLGILYGRVGMISLGQIGLLALGIWVGARLAYATSIPFPVLLFVDRADHGGARRAGRAAGAPAERPASGSDHADVRRRDQRDPQSDELPERRQGLHRPHPAGDLREIPDVRRPGLAEGDTAYYRYVVIVCALMFVLALLHVSTSPGGRGRRSARASRPRSPPASTSRSTSCGRSRSRRS